MTSANRKVEVLAQAKINVALRVLSSDSTGYHPLESLFIRLDLADRVIVTTTDGKRSVTADVPLGAPEKNLAFVAADRYAAATGWPAGWEVEIEKKIPIGGGLGGGSADAAAVLRGLNAVSPQVLLGGELQAISGTIGADVPFMTSDSVFAFAEGYGERLTSLPPLSERAVGLAVPSFQVSTREAYSWLDSDNAMRADRPRWDLADLSWTKIDQLLENDFTAVVSRRHPEIQKLIDWFKDRGAAAAGMTGSGSVVFGLFDEIPSEDGDRLPVDGKLLWTSTASRVVEPRLLG